MVDFQGQAAQTRKIIVAILIVACAVALVLDPLELLMELPTLFVDLSNSDEWNEQL